MPRLYKLMTAAIAFTGSLSLALSGETNPLFLIPGAAMLPGYAGYIRGAGPAPKGAVDGLSVLALLVLFFDSVFISGEFFLAVAHMTLAFQAIKSFDMREPWDNLQVYFMSLLQLVIASELSASVWMGAAFVVFLLMIITAMVYAHFIEAGTARSIGAWRPAMAISAMVLVSTVIFFAALPRFESGIWKRRAKGVIRSVGFSESVDFGSFGEVLLDPTVVMRVEISGKRQPLYWRGVSLDRFDGDSWVDSSTGKHAVFRSGEGFVLYEAGESEETIQRVIAEPMDTEVLFGLGGVASVEGVGRRLLSDDGGSVYMPSKRNLRTTYTVRSVSRIFGEKGDVGKYLQLPGGLDRVSALARDVAAGAVGDLGKAEVIEGYLRSNFLYSLDPGKPPSGVSPIEDFLFVSRRGYCEHFATAMVLMLRSAGVPARLVTGFAGGEENGFGGYVIVRQRNAHSWVEVMIGGEWRRFDPTPPAGPRMSNAFFLYLDSLKMKWYRYVVGFSAEDQMVILRTFRTPASIFGRGPGPGISIPPFYVVFFAALLALAAVLYIRRPFGRRFGNKKPETFLYVRLRDMVRKKGGSVMASSTSSEVLHEAGRVGLDPVRTELFIAAYERTRFGGSEEENAVRTRFFEIFGREGRDLKV